jgi:hypothetical protein
MLIKGKQLTEENQLGFHSQSVTSFVAIWTVICDSSIHNFFCEVSDVCILYLGLYLHTEVLNNVYLHPNDPFIIVNFNVVCQELYLLTLI